MNILSLFDGMSCGQIALRELGIPIKKYYASEIDKYAIQQTQHNFPNTIQLGDVENWQTWDINWESIDLVLAGSPCQGFSFAGKQLAFNDPRSKLFFVFIEILNHIKQVNHAVKFLLENVNMKRNHLAIISQCVGLYPVRINSNLVSAQNRDRWYWTNINTSRIGLLNDLHSDIPQPKDRGILLRDILEKDVDEKYYLSDKVVRNLIEHKNRHKSLGHGFGAKFHKENEKMQSLKCGGKGIDDLVSIYQLGRGFNKDGIHQDKTPTLTKNSYEQNNLVIQLNPSTESGGKQPYQQNRVYADYGQMPALTAELGGRNNIYNNHRIRRLTPIECARLQTIPDWYDWVVSDTQIYKMCGNGWTVEVIKYILSFLNK